MRVIAGSAGGIQLEVPKRGVRPTMDRVKAAIFSSLADKVIGARVLDLFAGSGGLGIEALSRGAASCLFIDHDRQAISTIERNLKKANAAEGKTRQQDVFDFIERAESLGKFDLVFADPPYEKMDSGEKFTDKLLADPGLARMVESDGLFVLEKRPAETVSALSFWKVIRQKAYGATEVLFLAHDSESTTIP